MIFGNLLFTTRNPNPISRDVRNVRSRDRNPNLVWQGGYPIRGKGPLFRGPISLEAEKRPRYADHRVKTAKSRSISSED